MPRKFAEMSSKFRFGQEFVEKPGISSNFVEFRRQVFALLLYNTVYHFRGINSTPLKRKKSIVVLTHRSYFGLAFVFCVLLGYIDLQFVFSIQILLLLLICHFVILFIFSSIEL